MYKKKFVGQKGKFLAINEMRMTKFDFIGFVVQLSSHMTNMLPNIEHYQDYGSTL